MLFTLVLSACNQNNEHPLVQNIEEIEDFPYDFKLPTHMPYKVEEVKLFHYNKRIDKLPEKLEDAKPMDFNLEVAFRGELEEELIIIGIKPKIELENSSGANEQQIKLSNSSEAEYYYNGSSQIVTWNDDSLNYNILVYLPEKDKELYSLDELIKVADSLAPYNRTN